MKIIYSSKHLKHDPPYEVYDGEYEVYAETPERIESISQELKLNGLQLDKPIKFPIKHIKRIHSEVYIKFIKQRSGNLTDSEVLYPSYFIKDTYTPITYGTYDAAIESSNVALTGAMCIIKGDRCVYSLCRPPGHHAECKAMSGYCYFNNAAICAQYLSVSGKVAILDIDLHHGNGTQDAFYDRSDVLYVSLHADPRFKFPYTTGFSNEIGEREGRGYNFNYPLPMGISNDEYKETLTLALKDIKSYDPDYLIVSTGFDTYINDPIGGFKLTIPFYKTVGKMIDSIKLPTLLIQEGGYNVDDLGKIALSFLRGFNIRAFEKDRKLL